MTDCRCFESYVCPFCRFPEFRAGGAVSPEPPAPAGWKLVPVEPTPEMISAAANTPGIKAIDNSSAIMQLRGYPISGDAIRAGSPLLQAWRAMLATAPEPLAVPAPAGLPALISLLSNERIEELARLTDEQVRRRAGLDGVWHFARNVEMEVRASYDAALSSLPAPAGLHKPKDSI